MRDQPTERISNPGLQLTSEERQLILDFRAMERCAQQMIVDCAAQYKCTLPAARPRLTLVTSDQVYAHQ